MAIFNIYIYYTHEYALYRHKHSLYFLKTCILTPLNAFVSYDTWQQLIMVYIPTARDRDSVMLQGKHT